MTRESITGVTMVGIRFGFVLGALFFAASSGSADETKVVYKPLKITGVQEFGQIQSGLLRSTSTPINDEWVDHFGSFLTQEALVNDRLRLEIGIGGTFQNGKPEKIDEKYGGSQYKMFFIGPTIAKATVLFGEPESPFFSIGGGIFPFKYNPQAVNLGEYLFRSGAYATYIMNGGLLMIGDNSAYLQGFHATAQFGNLNLDLLLTTETGMPPLYDWSISALANYNVGAGLLNIGAGVNFKRILPIDLERTQRQDAGNSYFNRNGIDYVGDKSYYQEQVKFYSAAIVEATPSSDTIGFDAKRATAQAAVDSLTGWLDPTTQKYPNAKYFTPAATILMANASLDLKKLIGTENMGVNDLLLYGEWALLGINNYPIFYEKQMERMPIMLGINLPAFGFLDRIAVQVEHFASPFQNNNQPLGGQNWATPWFPKGSEKEYSEKQYNDLSTKDDWAWSILMQRTFYSHFTLSGQIARDHLRTVGTDWFYGSRLEPTEDLHKISDWYWALQLAWSI